jgi:ferredoxin
MHYGHEMAASYRVELVNRSAREVAGAPAVHEAVRSIEVGPRRSILNAAVAAGERLPYSCRNGECGSCVAKLVSGTVAHPDATVLTPSQRNRGFILLCLAAPTADCSIEIGLAAQRSMYEPDDDD